MNRFEQLIEYAINDEEQKAQELFHEIVVEKSRQIYENIMAEEADEDLDEAKDEEDLDEGEEEDDACGRTNRPLVEHRHGIAGHLFAEPE